MYVMYKYNLLSPGATEELLIEKWFTAAQAILDQACVHLKPGKWKLSGSFIPTWERALGGGAGLCALSEGK